MLLRRWKIRPRLLIGFGLMLAMSALLVGIGGFGLFVSQKALTGITQELIPANNITVAGRTQLLISQSAAANMAASLFNTQEIKRHKAAWENAQKELDTQMAAFAKIAKTDEQKKNLADFAVYMDKYRKIVTPVMTKLVADGYPDAQTAMGEMREGDASFNPALEMLAKTETQLSSTSQAVFTKVDGMVNGLFVGLLVAFAVCVVLSIVLAQRVAQSIVDPVSKATRFAERIAGGDLRADSRDSARSEGEDEAAEMMNSLSSMQHSLAEIVGQVRQSAESIQVASTEVATGNLDLSQRTEQTASNLQQTASSMSELTGTVNQSADSAGTAKQLAGTAADAAGRGGHVVSQVVSTMDEISASSKKINDIIGTIDGIAFQTNILALNAAVEAARAGEQGRGFAVVAGEVRSLAQRSAEAAREIKSLISTSVEKVAAGTELVSNAGSTMTEIVSSVQRVTDIISEISAAASEQSQGIGRVNGAVTELDQMTQQNAALVEQSAAAAQSLKEQALRLSELMGRFTLT